MTIYRKRAGHCTRCHQPFVGNHAVAFMVWERVAAEIFEGGFATHQDQIVAVCEACLKPDETVAATIESICPGCDLALRSAPTVRFQACSDRCRQRALRARRRTLAHSWCAACGQGFKPKRSDARYCSAACKQRAYRARFSPSRASGRDTGHPHLGRPSGDTRHL